MLRGEGVLVFIGARGKMLLCIHRCKRRKEIFYLTTRSTHFIYGYTASNIRKRPIQIVREETRYRHCIGFPINGKGSFISTISDRTAHTTAFVIPFVCKI